MSLHGQLCHKWYLEKHARICECLEGLPCNTTIPHWILTGIECLYSISLTNSLLSIFKCFMPDDTSLVLPVLNRPCSALCKLESLSFYGNNLNSPCFPLCACGSADRPHGTDNCFAHAEIFLPVKTTECLSSAWSLAFIKFIRIYHSSDFCSSNRKQETWSWLKTS